MTAWCTSASGLKANKERDNCTSRQDAIFMGFMTKIRPTGTENLKGTVCVSSVEGKLVYKGYWINDQPHGEGIYYFKNGDVYHGDHDNGDYHGKGKFITIDGMVYTGEWNRGRRTGIANFFDIRTGVITRGLWKDDIFIEYRDHKSVAQHMQDFSEEPLQIGFDWTEHTGIKPHIHSHDDCNDGSHDHECSRCDSDAKEDASNIIKEA